MKKRSIQHRNNAHTQRHFHSVKIKRLYVILMSLSQNHYSAFVCFSSLSRPLILSSHLIRWMVDCVCVAGSFVSIDIFSCEYQFLGPKCNFSLTSLFWFVAHSHKPFGNIILSLFAIGFGNTIVQINRRAKNGCARRTYRIAISGAISIHTHTHTRIVEEALASDYRTFLFAILW